MQKLFGALLLIGILLVGSPFWSPAQGPLPSPSTGGGGAPSGSAGGALTGTYPNPTLANLITTGAIPFVLSVGSGVLTQDTGFTFNATGTVTATAGPKNLNIASTNNYAAILVTSNNLLRGSFGAASSDGLDISDQGGTSIWRQTYGTTSSAFSGSLSVKSLLTATNCSSSASPAVCASAAGGSVAVPAGVNPTLVVNTTAVTANSQIGIWVDSSLGTKLSVTCNTTVPALYKVSARTAATSFTIAITATVTTDPVCFSYSIVN